MTEKFTEHECFRFRPVIAKPLQQTDSRFPSWLVDPKMRGDCMDSQFDLADSQTGVKHQIQFAVKFVQLIVESPADRVMGSEEMSSPRRGNGSTENLV
jgi:hypothetical protein